MNKSTIEDYTIIDQITFLENTINDIYKKTNLTFQLLQAETSDMDIVSSISDRLYNMNQNLQYLNNKIIQKL